MSEMLEDALSEGGFLPEVLSSAEDAVTLLQGQVASFWAVVTDVNLRGAMTDLPRVAREREPSLPLRLHDREGCGDRARFGVPKSILLTSRSHRLSSSPRCPAPQCRRTTSVAVASEERNVPPRRLLLTGQAWLTSRAN